MTTITIDIKGLEGVIAGMSGSNPHTDDMLDQWGARYLNEMRRRAISLSRSGGAGEWPPLAESTIAARRSSIRVGNRTATIGGARRAALARVRKARTERQARLAARMIQKVARAATSTAILRDTGLMLNALSIGAIGNLFVKSSMTVRVGFDSTPHSGAGPSIGELAQIHHFGLGNVPARPLLVDPSSETISGMVDDAKRALRRIADAAKRSVRI